MKNQSKTPVARPRRTKRAGAFAKMLTAAGVALGLLAMASCRKSSSGPAAGPAASVSSGSQVEAADGVSLGAGKSYARVALKPEVKMLEAAQISSSLQGLSSDGRVLVFNHAGPQIQALKSGDVMLVKNQFVRKVVAVQTDGDETAVLTDAAAITDAVQDGDIEIDTPITFHGSGSPSAEIQPAGVGFGTALDNLFGEPAFAQNVGVISGLTTLNSLRNLTGCASNQQQQQQNQQKQGAGQRAASAVIGSMVSGWTITKWQVTPGNNELDLAMVLTKNEGGFVAMVALSGFVTNFQFATSLGVHNGAGSKIFTGVQKMTGKLHFDWQIGKQTPGVWATEDRMKLPVGVSIPLSALVGGMPLTLDVSAALLIHPALTGGNELSKGGFTVTWTGGGNISAQNGGAVGSDSNMQLTFQVTQDTNISPIAPNGMVIVYCAPRFELRYNVFGSLASGVVQACSAQIDAFASKMESMFLPAAAVQALAKSPLGGVTASAVLASSADVWLQFLATEGVTHSATVTPMPCSKQELKLTAQGGGDAQLFGLTKGAATSKDLFTKTYTRWDPGSDFCKKI